MVMVYYLTPVSFHRCHFDRVHPNLLEVKHCQKAPHLGRTLLIVFMVAALVAPEFTDPDWPWIPSLLLADLSTPLQCPLDQAICEWLQPGCNWTRFLDFALQNLGDLQILSPQILLVCSWRGCQTDSFKCFDFRFSFTAPTIPSENLKTL